MFNHEASQQEVFIEISQLVQSALDGFKVIFTLPPFGSVCVWQNTTHRKIGIKMVSHKIILPFDNS